MSICGWGGGGVGGWGGGVLEPKYRRVRGTHVLDRDFAKHKKSLKCLNLFPTK